jgi:hypothetical protein
MINVSELSVMARNSAIQYKKTIKSIQQIGEELHLTVSVVSTPSSATPVTSKVILFCLFNGTTWIQPLKNSFKIKNS